jgi:sec-independent protein translocase protein TatC
MFTATNYISFLTIFLLSCGLIFELPMMVYFLSKIGILSPAFMRQYRRHAVVIMMIVAAIITPTADVGTMMLVFMPLYFLYEMSIFIAAAVERNAEKETLT